MRWLVTICILWCDNILSILSGSDVGLYSCSSNTPVSHNVDNTHNINVNDSVFLPTFDWFFPSCHGARGGGTTRVKCEAQAQLLIRFRPDRTYPSQSHQEGKVRKKDMKKRGGKMTMTKGGTWTCDLANGLPDSNQVIWQLSGWVRLHKAKLPGFQLKRIPSWHAFFSFTF